MHTLNQPTCFQRKMSAVGLIGGSLLLVTSSSLARPAADDTVAATLNAARAQGGSMVAQLIVELLGWLLTFSGALAAATVLWERGVSLGNFAKVFSVLGAAGFAMSIAWGFVVYSLSQNADHVGMAAAAQVAQDGPGLKVSLPLILLGEIGFILLAAGFRRARLVPLWVPIVVALACIVDFAGSTTLMLVVSSVLALVSLGWIGLTIVKMDGRDSGQRSDIAPSVTAGQLT